MNGLSWLYFYGSNNKLVSMNLKGVEYCYIRSVQEDITRLFDDSGKQVVSYDYDSWGKLISIKDANGKDVTNDKTNAGYKNPYRYRGYRYDTETELYYLNSRYYNPDSIVGHKGDSLSLVMPLVMADYYLAFVMMVQHINQQKHWLWTELMLFLESILNNIIEFYSMECD